MMPRFWSLLSGWIGGASNATLTQKVHGDVTLPASIKASRRPTEEKENTSTK